jgi:hypothetical protein
MFALASAGTAFCRIGNFRLARTEKVLRFHAFLPPKVDRRNVFSDLVPATVAGIRSTTDSDFLLAIRSEHLPPAVEQAYCQTVVLLSHLTDRDNDWSRGFVLTRPRAVNPDPFSPSAAEINQICGYLVSDPFSTIFLNAYSRYGRPFDSNELGEGLLFFTRQLAKLNPVTFS